MSVLDYELPYMATIGINNALSMTVYDTDGVTPLVPTAGTLVVTDGSEVLEAPVVTAGSTSTATLLAASTAARSTSTRLLLTWLLTIAGDTKPYIRSGYLVNNQLYPVLSDLMITRRMPHLLSVLGSEVTTLENWRDSAWNELQRWLIIKGKRLDLALDQWAFVDMHRYWTVEILAGEFLASSTSDVDWYAIRDDMKAKRIEQQDTVSLHWDTNKDGTADESATEAVQGPVWLNEPYRGY